MEPRRSRFTFVDLFAGIGGFHHVLSHAGGKCVFACDIDEDARKTYEANWDTEGGIKGDIRDYAPDDRDLPVTIPPHDILAAGFPCQPFSKSGAQRGMSDETRGTLFFNIERTIEACTPSIVLLENVRNLVGPRHYGDYRTILKHLRHLGYRVSDEPSIFSPHLLPPNRGGTPQVRDRVFITAIRVNDGSSTVAPAPAVRREPVANWDPASWRATWVLDKEADPQATALNVREKEVVHAWNEFVQLMWQRTNERLPGFPLWVDEWRSLAQLDELVSATPELPDWKRKLLQKNAQFYEKYQTVLDPWLDTYRTRMASWPASWRKFEWQWDTASEVGLGDAILQFRPSGLRCKAPTYFPALVAITQTSIVGALNRRLSPRETARLQGLPANFRFHNPTAKAGFKQTGNGVASGAVWHVLRELVLQDAESQCLIPSRLRDAVLTAPLNPSPGILSAEAYETS